MTLTLLMMLAILQQGQPAATPVAPVAPPTPTPTPTPTEEWHRVSMSDVRAYLVNVGGMTTVDGVITVRLASVPRQPAEAGDRSHLIDDYAFNCSAGKYRVARSIDVPPEGGEGEVFEDPEAAWDDIPGRGLLTTLKEVACDGARSPTAIHPTLDAYLASARE